MTEAIWINTASARLDTNFCVCFSSWFEMLRMIVCEKGDCVWNVELQSNIALFSSSLCNFMVLTKDRVLPSGTAQQKQS